MPFGLDFKPLKIYVDKECMWGLNSFTQTNKCLLINLINYIEEARFFINIQQIVYLSSIFLLHS
jgi:hypothetical protein